MFLTFRYIISSLSSVSKEIICDLFPLHTHAHTHTHTTHTHIHTNTYSFSFVMALDVVCNFSQTKGLSGNQASNKISSNDKKQKATSIQFRTKKTIIFRDIWPYIDIKGQKYFSTKLPRFFNIQSGFSGKLVFSDFCQGKFSYIYFFIIFVVFLFHEKLSKKLSLKATKNYAERVNSLLRSVVKCKTHFKNLFAQTHLSALNIKKLHK